MNKKRLWTRGAAWLLTLCLLAGLCAPVTQAEEIEPTLAADTHSENQEVLTPDLMENNQNDVGELNPAGIEIFTANVSNQGFSTGYDDLSGTYSFTESGTGKNEATLTAPTLSGTTLTAGVKSGSQYIAFPPAIKYRTGSLEMKFLYTGNQVKRLSFHWTTSGCNTIDVNGSTDTSGDFSQNLSYGDTITITISSKEDVLNPSASITLSAISLELVVNNYTTNFIPAENGYYTVDGERISAETSKTNPATTIYGIQVYPNDGYEFVGFERTDTHVLISENKDSYSATDSLNVSAVFCKTSTAIFSVATKLFYNLNYANQYAVSNGKSVILLERSGNVYPCDEGYTINNGITLLVPFDNAATLSEKAPEGVESAATRTEFRLLTLKKNTKLSIKGALCVNSKALVKTGAQASIPTGPYGHIKTEQDTEIVVGNGASLYCWGYITGAGTVKLKSGASAYENFQMAGWRGGSETLDMTLLRGSSKVFPLNQYYTQNVEATLQIESGAKLYVYVVVTAQGIGKQTTTPVYFGDGGLFILKEGTIVTRKYDSETDRIIYVVDGDFEISSLQLSVATYPIDSNDYVLPLTSNMTVQIRSGTTTLSNKNGASLLPGVVFDVEQGATFLVKCDLFTYDREAWVGKKFAYGASQTRDNFEPIQYSPSRSGKRTLEDLLDAEIDVNGILRIEGNLYTTTRTAESENIDDFGANIHSSAGTGKVIFSGAAGTSTKTQEHVQGNGRTQTDVPITPAKLKNGGTGEGAKPYTETSGAPAGAVYYYDVDEFGNGSKNWYRFNVTYVINGTSDTKQLNTETALSDVTINGTIESVKVTVDGGQTVLGNVSLSQDNYDSTNKTLDISKILTAVQEYDAKNDYKNMGNVTISITTNQKGSSHPMFVLSAKQLRIYQSFGGTESFEKLTDKPGYYLVKDAGTLTGGTPCTADVNMHVPGDYAMFGWYMGEASDAQEFGNVVPGLDGSVVYIYGRYSGYAVEMSGYTPINHQSPHYTTIAEAMSYVTDVGNITYTLKMLADNDAFDAFADDGGKYTIPANRDITLDLNGFTVTGTITNNGTLTIRDSTHSDGTGKVTSASNNTITNAGTLTLESGKFVSTGGATAVMNNGTLNVDTGAAFKGKNADSSNVISGEANYPHGYQLSTSLVDGYFRVVLEEVTITWIDGDGKSTTSRVKQGEVPKYPGTENPVKTPGAGENCEYKFTGWMPELTAATKDAEYKAQFETIDKIRMTSGGTVHYFNTLQEAIDQSPGGATLTLQKTLDAASGTATFTKTLTLDLNGQTSFGNITVNSGVTLTIEGTGTISASGTAVRNKGTLILPPDIKVEATGNNGIALDNSGTIDSITGGTFTGHVAVQIESGGKIGSITGGTFRADAVSTVIYNRSTNAVKLSGDPKFGGVTGYTQVLSGDVTDTSKLFTFEPNMTISTSKNNGYFTIVPNTFQITFNVNGKNEETVEVSRANNSIDLQSLYGSKKPSKGEGYQFTGWSLTQNGEALGTTVTQAQLGNPGTGDTVTVYATWNVVYDVTITWGSLEYEYKGATYVWDGQNMKYTVEKGKDAHWESVDENNTVTVTNRTVDKKEGTVQVKAKYENTGGYAFDLLLQQDNTSLTNKSLTTEQMLGTVAPQGVSQSWSFLLDGTPSGTAFTKATVGKITLTLQPAK